MTTGQIQHLLAYLGYGIAADGIPGPLTTAAVRAFQTEYGSLDADGIPGKATQGAIAKAVGDGWARPEKTVVSDQSAGSFWDEIRYFSRSEFKCRCGEFHAPYCSGFPVEPDETLVRLADRVRGHFGRPAYPSSGIRCKKHNDDQRSAAANSRHLYGKALDFFIEGISGTELMAYIKAQPEVNYTYIIGGQYVHMDVK